LAGNGVKMGEAVASLESGVATNSDRQYSDLFAEREAGEAFSQVNNNLASEIMSVLIDEELVEVPEPGGERRPRPPSLLTWCSKSEGISMTSLERRGALGLLRATVEGDHAEWIYQYEGREDFRSHLEILRSEGLINYAYDDVNTIGATVRGIELLERPGSEAALGRPGRRHRRLRGRRRRPGTLRLFNRSSARRPGLFRGRVLAVRSR